MSHVLTREWVGAGGLDKLLVESIGVLQAKRSAPYEIVTVRNLRGTSHFTK